MFLPSLPIRPFHYYRIYTKNKSINSRRRTTVKTLIEHVFARRYMSMIRSACHACAEVA